MTRVPPKTTVLLWRKPGRQVQCFAMRPGVPVSANAVSAVLSGNRVIRVRRTGANRCYPSGVMESGSTLIEILTYGILAFVILAMIALLIRTLTLALGFLSLPLAEALQRWRPTREWLERREARRNARLSNRSS